MTSPHTAENMLIFLFIFYIFLPTQFRTKKKIVGTKKISMKISTATQPLLHS